MFEEELLMWVCCWQDKGRKSINIVTEKVSFQGVTRFEDRRRLPLGVATNFSAYAAKVLTQARLLPHALLRIRIYKHTLHALHHKGPPPNFVIIANLPAGGLPCHAT